MGRIKLKLAPKEFSIFLKESKPGSKLLLQKEGLISELKLGIDSYHDLLLEGCKFTVGEE
jgi:hypothetical protein